MGGEFGCSKCTHNHLTKNSYYRVHTSIMIVKINPKKAFSPKCNPAMLIVLPKLWISSNSSGKSVINMYKFHFVLLCFSSRKLESRFPGAWRKMGRHRAEMRSIQTDPVWFNFQQTLYTIQQFISVIMHTYAVIL